MGGRPAGTVWCAASLGMALAGASCRPAGDNAAPLAKADDRSASISALVSVPPQAYFVERVGGDRVGVDVLVRPGQSPATYEPTPRQMAALAQADVFFRIGVPFENHLVRKLSATVSSLRIVDTREGITLRRMEHRHHHGKDDHDHAAGEPDPHVWLDPRLVKIQARTICRELCRLDPTHRADYQRNLELFHGDLDALHAEIAAVLLPLEGSRFFVFHPAYGYFADAYGLEQVAVEAGGKEPSHKGLVRLIEQARKNRVRFIFVQPQFATGSAEAIARAIDGAVVPLDPVARDYMENMREMASKIRLVMDTDSQ